MPFLKDTPVKHLRNTGDRSKIKQEYEKLKGKTVSHGLISKYLSKLKGKELIKESIRNKFKYFESSELGKIYHKSLAFYNLI